MSLIVEYVYCYDHVIVIYLIYIFFIRITLRCIFIVFFFQAEDGIRDLVRSRGLGDVYKRQPFLTTLFKNLNYIDEKNKFLAENNIRALHLMAYMAVSYTHLTLPTSDLV